MENKNLHRLAELGLQTIADHHEVNHNLYEIELFAKKNKQSDVLQYVDNIRKALSRVKTVQYQKEVADKVITEMNILDYCKRIQKWFGTYTNEIEIDCKKDITVTTKKLMLLQSLINIVDNALHFSEKRNGKNWCKITIEENSITVSDDGNGVPDEIKDQIFDLYFTTKDISRQGCDVGGIGLYSVKEHLASIGYTLEVKNNTILKGANFKIIIPNI